MDEESEKKRTRIKHFLLTYGITFISSLVAVFIVMIILGVFATKDRLEIYNDISDSFMVVGVMLSGYGALVLVSNGGAFDMLAYGFISAIIILFPFYSKEKKHTSYYEYHLARREKGTHTFWHLVFIGLFHIAMSGLFAYIGFYA